ncbi:RbsD or FucU transport [Kribbella flavida DSM 17836]|uniref:RbsD or FucU transport n=1 Tax=Kribbella flavida (strain DSM 17836 / JCM 10339 / NBRC 14399) TaxID=479435 RepID=D2Q2A4_KRIFD|nr:RbsD/FucU family protein [Kribbella flavida]ADB35800.1 RbsD or FucU transport [Kribbella flavida DSM 17836]
MLRYPLIHPPLLGALARAGHGSVVLIADGNYPYATAVAPGVETIWLNLRPGQVPVDDVLATLLDVVPVEAARVMATATGEEPDIYSRFRELLPGTTLLPLPREDFYAVARSPELAVAVATGEQRLYANILLTLGVVT